MPEDTRRLVDLLVQLWNTGKPEIAEQLYTDQSERFDPNGPEPARGPQQIVKFVTEVRTAFPDFNLAIKQTVADGDYIVSHWTVTGTQKGEFQGIPATGRRIEINGLGLARVKDGRVINERVYFDRLGMLEQLGVAPGGTQSETKSAATANS
jgi:steroid delta-isomerase-like uncharacterized protein